MSTIGLAGELAGIRCPSPESIESIEFVEFVESIGFVESTELIGFVESLFVADRLSD
jgi:hypothetical protein